MLTTPTPDVRRILETDRVWCAYALADLDPEQAPHSRWLVGGEAVVLVYTGLEPPVLFAHGAPSSLAELFDRLPPGEYQYALMATDRALLGERLAASVEKRMWRMVLRPDRFRPELAEGAVRLSPDDLPEMQRLFDDHPDRPDAFHERQVSWGVFYGVRTDGGLASVAGTHIVSGAERTAAIGNVFTDPQRRGQGLATRATAGVVAELLRQGITTVVLNVAMDNAPALSSYRHLGFWPFCGYYEGLGRLS